MDGDAAGMPPTLSPKTRSIAEEALRFYLDLAKESDRALVIVVAAKLDQLLRNLIAAKLVPSPKSEDELLDGDRALSTFSSRISIAHRLGIVDVTVARSLDLIRRMRNTFAHEPQAASLLAPEHHQRLLEVVRPFRRYPQFASCFSTLCSDAENPTLREEFIATVILLAGLMSYFVESIEPISSRALISLDIRL